MGLYDYTFYDLVKSNAATLTDKVAWHEAKDGRTLSFSDYRSRVDRLARGLQGQGIEKGDRIGVVSKNSLEFFLLFGAAAATGAIVVPMNRRLSREEILRNLSDVSPKMLLADTEHLDMTADLAKKVSSPASCYHLGSEDRDVRGLESLMNNTGDVKPVDVRGEDGFLLLHTAAVAGQARGALLSHANVLWADMHFSYLMNMTRRDVHLNCLPLFHVGGLFMTTAAFHSGVLNVSMSRFDAGRAVELIEDLGVSFMMVFTPILSSMLDEARAGGARLRSLRAVTGLEAPPVIERFQEETGGIFYSMYGQTETSCLTTFGAYGERPGAAGRMLPVINLRLVDEYDREVGAGQAGEILVRGPMVFKGYWNLPEETAHAFRGGWHHTGDLGRLDADGYLWYEGRLPEKELIKPGGENVYPAEVERVILRHPAISGAVVFGVPDPRWKEGVKAVCRVKKGHRVTAQELIAFVGERIAAYKKPGHVEFVEDLPLRDDGTVDRAKVREHYGKGG